MKSRQEMGEMDLCSNLWQFDGSSAMPTAIRVSEALLKSISVVEENFSMVEAEPREKPMESGDYEADILFLGAGPAGYVGAIRAAKTSSRVVVVEKGNIGGTCLNIGCIPTKAMLSTAEVLALAKRAEEFGIKIDGFTIDFSRVMERKDKIVQQLRKGIEFLFKKNGVVVVKGVGRLVDAHTVEVATEDGVRRITARCIIIATGSTPALLPVSGLDVGGAVWTSTEALAAEKIPESILIVGGGYVGLEFGYFFSVMGSKVTVVEMLPRIAGNMDAEVAKELEKSLKRVGINILTESTVASAEDIENGKKVTIRRQDGSEETAEFERVLLAVGRKPLTQGIGLEEAGIRTDRGFIVVNDRLQTNVPNVYAAGDCIGEPMLAHAAFHEVLVAVENCLGGDAMLDNRAIPGVVFTHPEVATVGMTEEKAREQFGDDILIGRFPFAANGKALGMGEREGFVKVIAGPKHAEILGVHIIGPHATDMISEAVLAIQSEATLYDIEASVHPHPTLSEPIHEAALDALGKPLHKS
jgi:dihydrolipoamide dehydrogenase